MCMFGLPPSLPYQFFGHGRKPETLVHVWMIANVWACQCFFGSPSSLSSQCWPTHGQAKPLILASQIFGMTNLDTNRTHPITFHSFSLMMDCYTYNIVDPESYSRPQWVLHQKMSIFVTGVLPLGTVH